MQPVDFNRNRSYSLRGDIYGNIVNAGDKFDALYLGRYFSQRSPTTALLHSSHSLSKDIASKTLQRAFKIPQYWAPLFAHAVAHSAQLLFGRNINFDIVTVIPATGGKDPRLERLLDAISDVPHMESMQTSFDPKVFCLTENARDIKALGPTERDSEAQRTLSLTDSCASGKRLLIIDDVVTTGATLRTAITLAQQAGASAVYGLALAKLVRV
ncbi:MULTISPECIES: ComF family protein [unclassified Cupriavidus]|uniref:ComF family protein n=1 Tax=unclassified Cupriavidus TaxID=2640874 RepID=UPI001AE200EC|nr:MULTISPECIES: hypothetical protein [unclassified Cupriavidus]MBP0633673.1 hypothetical protein [Cupriavidus sp. AcVe19-1a]MBP0640172.1 hypothetical protein [Cupriavidus sp. AcVe19-6a]